MGPVREQFFHVHKEGGRISASLKSFFFPEQFHSFYTRRSSIAPMPTVNSMPTIAPRPELEAQSGRVCPKMLTALPNRPTVPSLKPAILSTRMRARKSPNTRAFISTNNTRPGNKNGCRAAKVSTNFDLAGNTADSQAQCRPSTFSQAIYSALRGSTSQHRSPDAGECHAPCLFPMDGLDGLDTTEWRDSQYRTLVEFDAGI